MINNVQDWISQITMAGVIMNQINVLVKTRPMHRKKIFFYRSWKGHWRCPRLGTCFAQHLPVRIFARGVTQGSREMTADTPVIPISKLVKSGRTIGGAQGWGHDLLNTCQWGSLPGWDAQGYKPKHSQGSHGSSGKSAHDSRDNICSLWCYKSICFRRI